MPHDEVLLLAECAVRPVRGIEAILLRELLSHPFCTHARLIDQAWGHRPGGGPLAVRANLQRQICHLRKALAPALRIVNRHGQGYALTGFVVGATRSEP